MLATLAAAWTLGRIAVRFGDDVAQAPGVRTANGFTTSSTESESPRTLSLES